MPQLPPVLLPRRTSALLLSEALLSFACYALALYVAEGALTWSRPFTSTDVVRILFVTSSVLIGCYLTGLYRVLRWGSRVSLLLHVCSVFGIALLIQGVLGYVQLDLALPRQAMAVGTFLNFVTLLVWRLAYSKLLGGLLAPEPVIFLGHDSVMQEIAYTVANRPETGFCVGGFLSDELPNGTTLESGTVLGRLSELDSVIRQTGSKRLVVAAHDQRLRLPMQKLMVAKRNKIVVQDAAGAFEQLCGSVCSRTFRPSSVLFSNDHAAKPRSLALQSVYTNLISIVVVLLSMPVLMLLTILIRLTSRGPGWITEHFVGIHGIPIVAHRFRCTDVDDARKLTPLGRIIRNLHLEYLPRTLNLIRGEIALVGPEPERIEFSELLCDSIPFYRERYAVKPGLTGWSQINMGEKQPVNCLTAIQFDLYYAKHISLPLDAYILLHSVRTTLGLLDR